MKLKELLGQVFPNKPYLTDHISEDVEATHADFRTVASVKALCSRSRINKTTKVCVVSTGDRDDNAANGRWTKTYNVVVCCTSNCGDWSMRSITCRIPMRIEVDGYDDVSIHPEDYEIADPNEEPYVSVDDDSNKLTIHFHRDNRVVLFFSTGQEGDDDPMELPVYGDWLQNTLGRYLVEHWLEWHGIGSL